MGDILCRICGEPWDSYGIDNGDMSAEEAKMFKEGKGCPSCDFGRKASATAETEAAFLIGLTTETDKDPIELLMNVKSINK
jgi:hypothetical protein